jgi:trk system potassium uptake protein
MMGHLLPVLNVLGFVVGLFATTMVVPWGVALINRDAALPIYNDSLLLTALCGAALWAITHRKKRELQPRDGFLLVSLVWATLPAFAALPLYLYFATTPAPISFTDAYFEAMSGLTTTGSTVLTGLDNLPHSINVWRCSLVWLGGMGIIVMAVAILPLLGVGGMQIYKAETPGPMKDAKLTPRITETAKGLYAVYLAMSVLCCVAYRTAGMSWFDAYCHMCATMGLGGFSTYDASFGQFNSPVIETIAIVFMTMAGFNFAMHFLVWRQRSLRPYVFCPEARWYLLALYSGVALVAVFLYVQGVYPTFIESLRHATFNVVSIATTTGFASVDYAKWPVFAPTLMLLMCCFVTCAGSTGGGIKMMRAVILFKQSRREITRILHPRIVNPVKLGSDIVENKVVLAVLAFMLLYGGIIILMTLALLFSGLDLVTAFTAVIASINNTGPGLGEVGPSSNYQSLSAFQTWLCTICMLLGRLELFSVLVIFTRTFWRK